MERTIRYSKKREAILAAIRGTSCHQIGRAHV